jgi:hypothetical protein
VSTAGRFRGWAAATLAVVAMTATGAFAQTGGVLTVGKEVPADYTTIQAAVNAARPGQVIQILDTEVYEEQVTIDGRETSPWPGVTGGKNGITIRYTPPAGTAQNSNFARPTIRYRDINNTSPRSVAEAQIVGERPGTSGNYETNGALRIIRAGGVTIDGIAVDGISAYPFGASSVWCPSAAGICSPLFHGNAAITLVVASDAVIRNCDIKNAYFGINVKDRNPGGVFGNPNPDDHDVTIPLSAFGKAGSHLFEYNRVHNNSVGFFFESAWDLGSTIRYNLIYNNFHTPATSAAITINKSDQNAGAFLFKDMYLTPIAIYNNTFYNNTGNFQGNWQIGGQHLIFNNIFSKSNPSDNPSSYMTIDGMFPNRMHNSVFSANYATSPMVFMCLSGFNCAANTEVAPRGCFVDSVKIVGFNTITGTPTSLTYCNSPSASENVDIVKPGALIPEDQESSSSLTIPASANVRWLQTEGWTRSSGSLDTLFLSLNETSPGFLVPKWDHPDVINFIKNKGWADAGIRNADGTLADLGAIPSSGASTQAAIARIKPVNVVKVSGTTATLDFSLNVQSGAFNNPRIKLLRWVSPLPNNIDSWANSFTVIPVSSISTITPPSAVLTAGGNKLNVTLPAALDTTNMYGFFEMVVEGIDASGNTVSSDVGFLPYRQYDDGDYSLNIEFFPPVGPITAATRITAVNAGDPVRMRVTALKGDEEFTTGSLRNVNFTLASNAAARMYSLSDDAPFTSVSSMAVPAATYMVYFTHAGNELVTASGAYVGGTQAFAFFGTAAITVKSTVKLVYNAGENGTITGAASQTVLSGASGETVVAIPDDGYTFHHWSDGVTTATRKDLNVQKDISVTAYFADADGNVSVASGDRTIPNGNNAETVVVAPVGSVTGEFTAGPNPVGKSSGGIAFFWQGRALSGGSLKVYDAAGNVVKKITIKDNAVIGNTGKRAVGLWDLKDSKGRLVSDGTYLVKGKIAASGGKAERVSVVVGVR